MVAHLVQKGWRVAIVTTAGLIRAGDEPWAVLTGDSLFVGDIARLLDAPLFGDAATPITGVASLDDAGPGAIAFVEQDHRVSSALDGGAAGARTGRSSPAGRCSSTSRR